MLNSGKTAIWYKENPNDQVWWLYSDVDEIIFSFDRIHKYYLFGDYPDKLTKEQKEIFDRENPYWVDFFTPSSERRAQKQ